MRRIPLVPLCLVDRVLIVLFSFFSINIFWLLENKPLLLDAWNLSYNSIGM